MVEDADIISAVRKIRKLIATFDAIGFPTNIIYSDEELNKLVPSGLPSKIVNLAFELHLALQKVESSKKYKSIIKKLSVEDYDG